MKDMLKIFGNTLQYIALMLPAFIGIEIIDIVLSEKNTFDMLFSKRFIIKSAFLITVGSLLVFAFQRGILQYAKHKYTYLAQKHAEKTHANKPKLNEGE